MFLSCRASKEHPSDIIANVGTDKLWKVEWLEDGQLMGNMTRYTGLDPIRISSMFGPGKDGIYMDYPKTYPTYVSGNS
ncbi:hypothetical protein NXW94_30150 [Bacteroides ovatus]|nr:hypothetical protein [Bacteroides ovatus]